MLVKADIRRRCKGKSVLRRHIAGLIGNTLTLINQPTLIKAINEASSRDDSRNNLVLDGEAMSQLYPSQLRLRTYVKSDSDSRLCLPAMPREKALTLVFVIL